ncbi:site-specific integrase [Lentzea terrae]|uniref:hypothetical protein n=1 Tax=Lentzea terrae TaxID=2200761 RepID=UPI002FCD8951
MTAEDLLNSVKPPAPTFAEYIPVVAAAVTQLDSLIVRFHTETAARRGGALALRPKDLDEEQCLVYLREKGETSR